MLFNKRLLQTHLNSFEFPQGYDFERTHKIIGNWQKAIRDGNYDKTKETQVQSSFLNLFFNVVLGYAEMHDNSDEWHLVNEAKTEFDGTKADGALGYFTKDDKTNITRAVIELKDAKTSLDAKQSTRKDYDSPVSQAFSYSSKFDRCDWIIVSNFKEIRLYHKDRGQGYYESFEILNLNNESEFKRFYFLLCKENLIDKTRSSVLDNLVKDTSKNEEDISKQFYKDFKALRQELFQHLCEYNPTIDKKCLLEKTQKFLDRLIFIMFCEDSANLLPHNTLKNYYETGKNLPIPSDDKVWQIIKGLFHSIDKGNSDVKPPINKYNGGLFAVDDILDNLIIKDSAWTNVVKLADYDFESDLNVNILGHIFEQSLSDLEQIKSEIDGIEQDKTKSKRKKDGIFYTPEYITRYIVEQTVGKYLDENPDKLETIKILDPACGSGAFVNQAHTFLKEQYKIRTEEKIDSERASKRGGQEFVQVNMLKHTNMAETDRSILLNNLYGVDLNEESTEITKLALWLKTAKKDQPLQNLDNNIKCGNSLIDDPEIACDKAFKWEDEFPEIMQQGGFDCIIGNPPYGAEININAKSYYQEKYKETIVRYLNTYNFFIQKALNLLKEGGYLSFILPNTLLFQLEDSNTRKFLLNNCEIQTIINLGDGIFENADVPTCLFVVKKTSNKLSALYNYADLRKFKNIDYELNFNSYLNPYDINLVRNIESNIFGLDKTFDTIFEKLINMNTIGNVVDAVSQGIITGENSIYLLKDENIRQNNLENELIKPILRGENINKYFYNYEGNKILYINNSTNINNYINTQKYLGQFNEKFWHLHRARNENLFTGEKILLRQTGDKLIATYDNKNYYALNSLLVLKLSEDNQHVYKYILTLLNSKFMQYIYSNISQENGRAFAEVKPANIRRLPIPNFTQEQQKSLANKAEQMIELNKQLHEGIKSALDLLQAEYQPKKISQNLEKFYTLGLHPFLEELEKQGVKLSLSQKEELLTYYKQKSETLNNIKTQIDTLDHSIDQEVYKLYNLTPEEIQIIEGG